MKILCVGAGLANASLIHFIKKYSPNSHKSLFFDVIDKRSHIGGNCYTAKDDETSLTIHEYGPHIFNTNSSLAWDFINSYLTMIPFTNRVKACNSKGIFSFPINLHTINQLFDKRLNAAEAKALINQLTAPYKKEHCNNFEDVMLSHLGKELYQNFIYGYTKKQWGVEPSDLPASIAKRLPFRLTYDDNYYNKIFQGLPLEGYTKLFETIFSGKNISLNLNTSFTHQMQEKYDLVIFTGAIDAFFQYELGQLSYRTVFWSKNISEGIFQGNAVINYTDESEAYTRINEPFFFEPWRTDLPTSKSIYFTEFSKQTEINDEPYYPVRLKSDMTLLKNYQTKASLKEFSKVIFHGRLGTYRYLDMDKVIEESDQLAQKINKEFL